jgi:hypothetical protein
MSLSSPHHHRRLFLDPVMFLSLSVSFFFSGSRLFILGFVSCSSEDWEGGSAAAGFAAV